jgi:hypothetical protein
MNWGGRIKSFLNQFVELYDKEEEYQRRLANYQRVLKTEEWQFVKDTLVTIRGTMLTDMFSRKYTELDPLEKDVIQKTYYNIDQMITFLLSPAGWIKKKSKWSSLTSNLKGKGNPSQERKGK